MEQERLQQQLEDREQALDEHFQKFTSIQDEVQHKNKLLKKVCAMAMTSTDRVLQFVFCCSSKLLSLLRSVF